MAEEKEEKTGAMVSFINERGAIHTVPKALYDAQYKGTGKGRKLTPAMEKKLAELTSKSAGLLEKRHGAMKEDGVTPDHEARAKAAREYQKAHKAEVDYRLSLVEED